MRSRRAGRVPTPAWRAMLCPEQRRASWTGDYAPRLRRTSVGLMRGGVGWRAHCGYRRPCDAESYSHGRGTLRRVDLTAQRVSVVGLGLLGSAMARAYVEGGFDVTAWNRSPAA